MERKWIDLILSSPWALQRGVEWITFGLPAEESKIAAISLELPAELRSLLRTCDGVENLIMSVDQLIVCNAEFHSYDFPYRNLAMMPGETPDEPVDSFVVFSEGLGNGDYYAICRAPVESFNVGEVIHWNHETNERSLVAKSLDEFIRDSKLEMS